MSRDFPEVLKKEPPRKMFMFVFMKHDLDVLLLMLQDHIDKPRLQKFVKYEDKMLMLTQKADVKLDELRKTCRRRNTRSSTGACPNTSSTPSFTSTSARRARSNSSPNSSPFSTCRPGTALPDVQEGRLGIFDAHRPTRRATPRRRCTRSSQDTTSVPCLT